jgi:protein involved in polysaccharide export with SLBB domain
LIGRGYGANLVALNETFRNPVNGGRAGTTAQLPARTQPYQNPDNPQAQHRQSPYRNMPSLSDLYSQFPVARARLRRFGSDAFLIANGSASGAGNANELPMDLPAGPDYILGPGDGLTVNMWGGLSTRLSRIIDRQGQVELPQAGSVMIDGMTIAQAEASIQKALDRQFHEEHVEISLGRLRTVRVYVVGDVQRPGAYDVSSLSTPLSALYAAGGPTSHGSLRILRQYRGKQLVRQFDLYDFLLRGVRSNDDRLLPGDTILVPPAGAQVSIEGTVRRPAIYELNGEQGLNQVLDLAGGLLVSANLKQITVERIDAHQGRTMFNLQLSDNREEADQKLAAFKLQDGDDVLISQIMPYNDQAVYLAGHVFHPGKYPYRDGMTLNDLLRSYQDVMPEPSDHAELIRLQAPDFRPVTMNFNLADVLIGNQTIPLRPFDLIRVYGRYELDAPSVIINGEVLRPGKYPMSQGMTATDLVRMAGGLRRSAFKSEADLSSYSIQDGQKVLINHADVALERALDGDKNADLVLKPGDVISIRTLAGWQDIGATVTIQGEVEHAGSYGIQAGERLSAVLKRAGGFRNDAYPYAAIFERVQVRELNEQARQQMILRIEETPVGVSSTTPTTGQSADDNRKMLETQRQEMLASLRNHPASGRLVVNISSDISRWENTPADLEMRAGDTLLIPKRPEFVMTGGQVYNPVAITYVPGKNLKWYLRKAGGATRSGNKKDIYVLRADGSVVPRDRGWMGNDFMSMRMRPGDTIFVPEKIAGGSQVWAGIAAMTQALTLTMIPLAAAGVL